MSWDPELVEVFCVNGDRNPVVGERINGMFGEDEVVDLLCAECLEAS